MTAYRLVVDGEEKVQTLESPLKSGAQQLGQPFRPEIEPQKPGNAEGYAQGA
jgi:hypothetical protein